MKNKFMVILFMALEFVFIFNNASPVRAQETNSGEFTLEEITVTAQKREENVQKVPIAMEIVTGDEMRELGKNDISQVLDNLSNVIVNKSGNSMKISIRGYSDDNPEETIQYSAPTIAVNLDGVMSNRQKEGQGFYDVERIEVLAGPQSTLYASATPGGVVNVIFSSPKLGKYEASGTVEYGSYNLLHTEGIVNAPISETMAIRASFSTSVRDGYLSNGGDDEDSKSARIKMLYNHSDTLSFLLSGEMSKVNNHGFSGVVPFKNQDDEDDPWTSADSEAGNTKQSTSKKIYGTVDWNTGIGDLTITPSYTVSSNPSEGSSTDTMTGNVVNYNTFHEIDEKGVEVRLASPEDLFFQYIVGLVWYESRDDEDTTNDDGSWSTRYSLQKTKAVYANVTYPVTDLFRITGGTRITNDTNYRWENKYPNTGWLEMPFIVDMSYTNPDYKLGVEYDLSETSMLYSDITTSYRTTAGYFHKDYSTFDPEELTAINLGIKNRFFENRLQINASGYHYDYKHYIASTATDFIDYKDLDGDGDYDGTNLYDPDTGEYRNEAVRDWDPASMNDGDLEIYGFDLQTTTIITNNDKVNLSISYMKSEFTDLYFDYMDATNEQGVPDLDVSGQEKTYSPSWTISGSYDHNFDLPNGGVLTTRLDARFKSKYIMNWCEVQVQMDTETGEILTNDISELREQEAFYKANFYMTYENPDRKWNLTAYVKNITDYAEKLSYVTMGFGSGTMMIGAPRTFGVILSIKY